MLGARGRGGRGLGAGGLGEGGDPSFPLRQVERLGSQALIDHLHGGKQLDLRSHSDPLDSFTGPLLRRDLSSVGPV